MFIRLAIIWTLLISTNICGQSSIDGQEYEIYNFLIKKAFTEHGISEKADNKKQTPIIYGDYNFQNKTTTENCWLLADDGKEIITDTFYLAFTKLNKVRYSVDTKKLDAKAFSSSKSIYISFSRCHIKDGIALVYLGIQFAGLDGEGLVYILKQDATDKSWTVLKKFRKWVS